MDKKQQQAVIRLLQAIDLPEPLEKQDLDYSPYDVSQLFYKTYQTLFQQVQHIHQALLTTRLKSQQDQGLNRQLQAQKQIANQVKRNGESENFSQEISYDLLKVLEQFAIQLIEDIYLKIDVQELRFQQTKFPIKLKETLMKLKQEHIDDTISDFESDEPNSQNLLSYKSKLFKKKKPHFSKKEAKIKIQEKDEELEKLKSQLIQQQKSVDQLRSGCYKEVNNLREQIIKKEKLGHEFQEIDVRYFDISEGIPEEYHYLMNQKLNQMKEGYYRILKKVADSNKHLFERVAMLDQINRDGIKFNEMTAQHLFKRLALIEKSPNEIWKCIHENYGDDYFLEVIEEEYGINADANEKLKHEIEQTFKNLGIQSQKKLLELRNQYENQIKNLQKDLQIKNEEISKLNRQVYLIVERTKHQTESNLENLYKQKEIIAFNKYDADKHELYQKIKELELTCENFEKFRTMVVQKMFFTKLLFFTKIHLLRGQDNETRPQLALRTEQQLLEREMRIQDINRIIQEKDTFKEENNEQINQIQVLKFQLSESEHQNSVLEQQLNQLTERLEGNIKSNDEFKRRIEFLQMDNLSMRERFQEQNLLLITQQEQIAHLQQKVQRGTFESGKLTTKTALRQVKNQYAQQLFALGEEVHKLIEVMQKQEKKEVGMVTQLSGIHKPFGLLAQKIEIIQLNKNTSTRKIETIDFSMQAKNAEIPKIASQDQEIQVSTTPINIQQQQQPQQQQEKYEPNEYDDTQDDSKSFFVTNNQNSGNQNQKKFHDIKKSKTSFTSLNEKSSENNDLDDMNADIDVPVNSITKLNLLNSKKASLLLNPIIEQQDDDQQNNILVSAKNGKIRVVQRQPSSKKQKALSFSQDFPLTDKDQTHGLIQRYLNEADEDQDQLKGDVYSRLWKDKQIRNDNSVAAITFFNNQRVQNESEIISSQDQSQYIIKKSSSEAQHPEVQSLYNVNSSKIIEQNEYDKPNSRSKRNRNQHQSQHQSKIVEHTFKVIPYKLGIMNNILNKVYVDKLDKGIQVDNQSIFDITSQDQAKHEAIEESTKALKKLNKQRRHRKNVSSLIGQDQIHKQMQNEFIEQFKQRHHINSSFDRKNNVSQTEIHTSGQISIYTPSELQVQPIVSISNKKLLSPKQQKEKQQTNWKEQEQIKFEFKSNKTSIDQLKNQKDSRNKQKSKDSFQDKNAKSLFKMRRSIRVEQDSDAVSLNMLPIHSKDSFCQAFIPTIVKKVQRKILNHYQQDYNSNIK